MSSEHFIEKILCIQNDKGRILRTIESKVQQKPLISAMRGSGNNAKSDQKQKRIEKDRLENSKEISNIFVL